MRLPWVTAFFYNTDPTPPEHTTEFLSTEDQAPKRTTQRETCSRVTIAPAFFGSFTPALPSDSLRQLTGANNKDLTRGVWRSGRLSESRSGGPKQEGCFLSVKNSVLRRLPDNVRLVWVYEIDGNRCGFFTYR